MCFKLYELLGFLNIHSHLVIIYLCVRIDVDTPSAATMTKTQVRFWEQLERYDKVIK